MKIPGVKDSEREIDDLPSSIFFFLFAVLLSTSKLKFDTINISDRHNLDFGM